jgi:predicted dehydrogenase
MENLTQNLDAGLTRREFLLKGTLAGAGLVFGAPAILKAAAGPEAPSNVINVGFIGCGKQQEVLFNAMVNIPGLRYTAVCDIMKDRVGGSFGRIKARFGNSPGRYIDAEEMLEKEKDLDAVVVSTPDFWHAPHTVMALKAGKHVYCEKMMSNTIEGARSMVKAMDETGKLCQIGHQRRSNPRYIYTLQELIRNHKICGRIVNANAQWNRAVSSSRDISAPSRILPNAQTLLKYGFGREAQELPIEELQRRFLNWRLYKDLSGGPISDLGAHQIDIFNWFFGGPPKSVMASGGCDYFKDREHFDNVMCIFDYDTPEGGARAFYQVLTTTSAGGGYSEAFMGTEGTIEISERAAYTKIYRESGSAPSWEPLVQKGWLKKATAPARPSESSDAIASYASAPPEGFELPGGMNEPPHQPHLANFFAAVRGEAKLNCDAREALQSEAPIYWVNPAAERKETIIFTPEHLHT